MRSPRQLERSNGAGGARSGAGTASHCRSDPSLSEPSSPSMVARRVGQKELCV